MEAKIQIPEKPLRQFCQHHHVRRLSVFGSVLRDDFRPDSDIDILVEFEATHVPGFFRLAEMERELEMLFDGRKIDLRTPEELSRYFREEVLSTAEVCYVHQ